MQLLLNKGRGTACCLFSIMVFVYSPDVMKYYDCVSCVVNRFLEPFTECASVSDAKDRYYT